MVICSCWHFLWFCDRKLENFQVLILLLEMDLQVFIEGKDNKEGGIRTDNSSSCTRFPESLFDAELLVKLSARKAVLPDVGGKKEFSPESDSDIGKINEYYEELGTVLSEERVCKRGSLSSGHWDANIELIIVEQAFGSHWQKFGTKQGNVCYALPEEGLFLIEQGLFELYLNQLPLSMQEAWMLLHEHIPSLEYYITFSFLCRQGFGVLCSRKVQCLSKVERSVKGGDTQNLSVLEVADKTLETVDIDIRIENEHTDDMNAVDCNHITHLTSDKDTLCTSKHDASLARCSEMEDLPTIRPSTFDYDMESPYLDIPAKLENVSAFRNATSDSEMEEACHDKTANISTDTATKRDASSLQNSKATKTDPCGTPIELTDKRDRNIDMEVEVTDDNTPIVKPLDATSVKVILSKLQIIKPLNMSSQNRAAFNEPQIHLGPHLDVYQKGSTFKKSDPGCPDYRVYSRKYTDPPPSQNELETIMRVAEGIPVKFAICSRGSVTFYAFINTDVSKGL